MTLEKEWGLSAEFYNCKTINQAYPGQAGHGFISLCALMVKNPSLNTRRFLKTTGVLMLTWN